MKKRVTFRPVLATLCVLPFAVHAQQPVGATQPSQPSGTSQASSPSSPTVPASSLWQGTPSQAPGVPYPSNVYYPDAAFAPAGTQANTVEEEVGPGLQFRVMGGLEHESNVTRVNSGQISDTALFAGAGLRVDRRFGLQRLRADLEANTYHYNNHSSLDYDIFNYALAWDWSLTPRFHGVIGANQQQYREVQLDPVTLANQVGRRSDRTQLLQGIYEIGAAWRLTGDLSRNESTTSLSNSWNGNPTITNARLGVGYEFASGASVYGRHRHGKGSYDDSAAAAAGGDFKEDETDVVLKWPVTGKTLLDARLGHLRRKHDDNTQRDFSGMVGSAVVSWAITGKTSIAAGVSRDLAATGDAVGGRVTSDRVFIGPVWRVTPLVAVNLRYDHISRTWDDIPAGSFNAGRDESANVLSAGVEWQPLRWMSVTGYVRGERQSSNANTGYRNTTVGAAVKAFF